MKFIPLSAAVVAAALTVMSTASAQSFSTLPAPPTASGQPSSTIFDAMLAIARAATTNPQAAQAASLSYNAAIQQYRAGDFNRAQLSALQSLSQSAAVPQPQPSLYPAPIPQPSFYALRNVRSSDQADAEAYLALARRALQTCGAPGTSPQAAAIQQQYGVAVDTLMTRKYAASTTASTALINRCGDAMRAYAAQQAALANVASTPIPMESYSPVPVATLIPDPALQPAKQ